MGIAAYVTDTLEDHGNALLALEGAVAAQTSLLSVQKAVAGGLTQIELHSSFH